MVKSNRTYYRKQDLKEDHNLQNGYNIEAFETSMLFANRKELYVSNGSSINIYNPNGGSLVEVLEGHSCKVINICKNVQVSEECLASCDEKGQVFLWYSDRNHPKHGSSFTVPVGENQRVTHFSMSKQLCVYSFFSCISHKTSLAIINLHSKHKRRFVITKDIKSGQYKVAVSNDEKYVAALKNKMVYIMDISTQKYGNNSISRHHKVRFDHCCVAFHPTKDVMATGNVNGAIHLWYHFLEKSPIKLQLHWHTMPVRTFSFSSTGGDLFSGGEECVVVRWKLSQDNIKSFLPRLGMPIKNIQTDPLNSLVAVLHRDESINIIDSESMKLEGSIQRMSRHLPLMIDSMDLLSAGLLYHSPSASFIKNGKTGHLQFFNPQLLKVNYNLDITMCNFVTEERHKKLPNSDVTNAAVTDDGLWLVTVESCRLTGKLKEIIMKFWKFDSIHQRWELNTSIQSPHSKTITCFAFGYHQSGDAPMCISCSEDKKFKVWKLITYEDLTGKEQSHWNSRVSHEYRDLAATACAFASDNSLYAVAFKNIVTLWSPDEETMKRILTQPVLTEKITDISFSSRSWEGSALVTRSEGYICSWDLLSCSLMWRVYIQSTLLVIDRTCDLMAVFSKNKQVYFFEAKSCKPIGSDIKIESEAVCAQFAPYDELTNDATMKKESKRCLYFFDVKQNFLRLDVPSNANKNIDEEPSRESTSSEGRRTTIEPTTVESVKTNGVDDASKLLAALSGKSKHVTKKFVDQDRIDVNLNAPSMNDLIKDIHDVQIHSFSFMDFASHVSTFLPDLSEKEKSRQSLRYETIDQRYEIRKAAFDNVYLEEEEKRIKALQKVDFGKLLQGFKS